MLTPNIPEPELPELSKENFKRLSPEACRVFAFRAAVRVMPLIGGGEVGLAFWATDDRPQHMAAVVAAIDLALLLTNKRAVVNVNTINETTYAAANIAHEVAATDKNAAHAANIIRDVVAASYSLDFVDNIVDKAVRITIETKGINSKDVNAAMKWDLMQILLSLGEVDPAGLLTVPLWTRFNGVDEFPDEWVSIFERWQLSMTEIGMEDIVGRYMDLVDANHWNIDETEERFLTWHKEFEEVNGLEIKRNDSIGKILMSDEPQDLSGQYAYHEPLKKPPSPNTIKTASIANPTGDHATTKDALGREALVKALAAFLDHKEYKGQNTIGLLGHWGAGKSSVLNMLEDALAENPQNGFNKPKTKYLTATFNAWAYEHTDNIQAGLAQEVVSGLTEKLSFLKRIGLARRFAKETQPLKYRMSVVGFIFVLLAAIVTGYLGEETWQSVGAAAGGLAATLLFIWKLTNTVFAHPLADKLQTYLRLPSFGKHIGQLPVIQQQVKALCKLVLTPNGKGNGKMIMTNDKRLLLMIDDLDRCGEDGIVKTLEAVKLVMDLPNVTTIIAVDHRMALAALAVHYHNLAEKGSERTAHAIARDYLGKILTLPIQLDTPGDAEIGEYLDKVLFVNLEIEDVSTEFKSATSIDGNDIDEPAEEAINSRPGGMGNIDPVEPADNFEDEAFNSGLGSKQDSEEVVASKKERVLVGEVVKDSKEERDQFASLSKALKITNPRQLKRLHNSYRLLKALDFHQVGGDKGFYGAVHERLLAMIFWMEWISCLDKKARDKEEEFMRMPAYKESSLDGLNFSKSTYDMIKGMLFPHYALDESSDSYDGLKERVKVFMLPFADISNEPVNEDDKK